MSSPSKSELSSRTGSAAGEILLAVGVASLGVFLLLGISDIPFGAGYDRIGPRFFPYAVAFGLILLGGLLAVGVLRGGASERKNTDSPAEPLLNWQSLGILTLSLLLNLALLNRAGFVIACSVQFWLVARAFHSKHLLRDAVVAVLLSSVVYFSFSNLLGLTLPAGILDGLF